MMIDPDCQKKSLYIRLFQTFSLNLTYISDVNRWARLDMKN